MSDIFVRKCKCGTLMVVEIRYRYEGCKSVGTEIACLDGCFLRLHNHQLKAKHLANYMEGEPGNKHWVGNYQGHVYCSGCGGLRYMCTFNYVADYPRTTK